MVVLGIAGIFFSTAAPSFMSLIEKNRVRAAISEVGSLLKTARYEAVSRGTTATFCASSDGTSCSGSANWEQGWIIQVDDGSNTVIHAGTSFGPTITVRGLSGNFSGNKIEFKSNGTIDNPGTVRVCSNNQTDRATAINLNIVGHLHVSNNDFQGNSITSCT